ncbi:hypothetical protein [Staphylothermus hellenicus]|nr:hypothetical protein [Staphylothermus hellenicus]
MRSLVDLLMFLGLPGVAASALAVLIKESIPLSLNELSQKTGYAKSHLCTHLKHLAFNGLVKVKKVGRKKLFYTDGDTLARLILKHLSELKSRIDFAASETNNSELSNILLSYSRRLHEVIYLGKT